VRLFRRGEPAPSLDLLVAGLGNPGREYARNRHSVGFMVCDELARRHGGSWREKFSGDLAEVRLGDLPRTAARYLPPGAKHAAEQQALDELLAPLGPRGSELYAEYRGKRSAEARFVAACDKLQLMLKVTLYERWGAGGLGEFCIRPARLAAAFGFEEILPLMDLAYDAFGPRRMMYGSDYPPVGRREGYRNSLQGVLELPIWKSQEEKDWAFGQAAVAAFKLG